MNTHTIGYLGCKSSVLHCACISLTRKSAPAAAAAVALAAVKFVLKPLYALRHLKLAVHDRNATSSTVLVTSIFVTYTILAATSPQQERMQICNFSQGMSWQENINKTPPLIVVVGKIESSTNVLPLEALLCLLVLRLILIFSLLSPLL